MATCLWACLSRTRPVLFGMCVFLGCVGVAFAQDDLEVKDSPTTIKAKKLAQRLDQLIDASMEKYNVKPAPMAPEVTYFRRLSLDLQGRIPTLLEITDFLDDFRENKRSIWIEKMLESQQSSNHLATVWRSILLPNKVEPSTIGGRSAFEQSLRSYFEKNTSYKTLARDIITNRTPYNGSGLGSFYALHGNTPEAMATATSRVFLGVKLDCAQCHSHPFAKWTQEQFWEMAAFFNAAQMVKNTSNGRTPAIRIPKTKKVVVAKFLNEKEPDFKANSSGRQVLAEWVVSKENPFFAKATVDHIWMRFFGVSLFEPILQDDQDAIQHPELLDTLAKAFVENDYDVKFIIRAIVHTKAYQRSTKSKKGDVLPLALFARMPLRVLTAEQMYDSVITATSPLEQNSNIQSRSGPYNPYQPIQNPRMLLQLKFPEQRDFAKNQTSILQALFLMNGKWLAERVDGKTNKAIREIVKSEVPLERKLRTFYRMILSREPLANEQKRYLRYLKAAESKDDQAVRFSNLAWAMLNSTEFRVNH